MNVIGQITNRFHTAKTLVETGMFRPSRPDKLLRVGVALQKWGPTPAAGYTASAIRYPDETAVIDELGTLTFRDVHERTNALAHALSDAGILEGDGVAIMCRNHRGFIDATVACSKLGANALYLNTAFAGPDMWLGAYVEKELGVKLHVWDGECHVHAGIRPHDINDMRAEHPDADFLIHPECGCVTQVMEYVAAGDVSSEGVHMLSTGGMLKYAESAEPGGEAIVATETGMLYPLQMAAPDVDFIPANRAASCRYMKMITLTKLRDSLRDLRHEVKVPEEVAVKARIPIERMVAIG